MPGIGVFFYGLFYLILFAAILFLAYVSTKLLGAKAVRGMRGRHLKVVDSIVLGFDRQIYLIKAGEQFLLVSSSNKSIKFMTLLDSSQVRLTEEDLKELEQEQTISVNTVFKNYFEMFRNLSPKKEASISLKENNPNEARFNQNLNKLKGIFSKINSEKNGDEKPNE